ncbi:MAG: LacI family DNA-binding transcriptional regulator [Treponema sp.]|nr:LacI family DNA-binding transcriptional regulator [Treponema sp.]
MSASYPGAQKTKRPTIKDIAARAGVSKTTVSFALNDPSRISEATYRRVMDIVNELDYVPSPVARTLTTKRLGALGLLLPQSITEALGNPYVVEIIRGIGEVCEPRELSLTMLPPVKGKVIEAARRAFVDGLITIGVGPDHEVVDLLTKRHIPFVTIDGAESEATPNVGIDDEGAAYELMRHVLALGHRKIAILSLMPEAVYLPEWSFSLVRDMRLSGFSRALGEAGLGLDSDGILVLPTGGTFEGGARVSIGLLADEARRPTAIVSMADAAALGVYETCRDLGISIPDELSVAGFDDIPMATMASPPLTTVRQPGREKGRAAASLAIELLEGAPATHRRLETVLAPRASTAAPRSAPPVGAPAAMPRAASTAVKAADAAAQDSAGPSSLTAQGGSAATSTSPAGRSGSALSRRPGSRRA